MMNAVAIDESNPACAHGYLGAIGCPDCQAVIKAAQEAEEQRQREERAQEASRLEREKNEQRYGPIYDRIVEAVRALDMPAERDGFVVKVDGISMSWRLHMQPERRRVSSFRSVETERVRVVTGSYGNKVSYPQRKDGTHDYESIARFLVNHAKQQRATQTAEQNRAYNKPGVDTFRQEKGLVLFTGPMRVEPSALRAKPIAVKVDIQQSMTYHEAEKLHAALKALGYIK